MQVLNKNFSLKKSLIVITFCGILAAIAIQYFIVPASTSPTEVMGVVTAISAFIFYYGDANYLVFFWTVYLLALLPFIAFGYFKVGKMFSYLTLYFSLISTLAGLFFTILGIIAPKSGFLDFKLFGTATNIGLRFLYATCGSLTYGAALGFSLKMGASSGGTDFIARWLSNKKNIHISFMFMVFAILTLMIATLFFEIGMKHNLYGIPYDQIPLVGWVKTFLLSVWQCIAGPILIYFIYNPKKDPYHAQD